ncbi:trans-sialidase, putative [Trypanosoma cruzi marinkellei]|uniref:Trans-sialidase, putative n=1 Tax=Trypanosoma cruzi marinkellei TaxID=85056 RepID=K2MUM5_TRYCR|nr:trans-sialidase, putative [Trypanosoma cruzi marinkellei]
MRMPRWRHFLHNKRLARRSIQKGQARQQETHAGSTNAGTQNGPGNSATGSSTQMQRPDPTTDHGIRRIIDCSNAVSLGVGSATVRGCPSMHDGPHETECRPRCYGRPSRYSGIFFATSNKKKKIIALSRILAALPLDQQCTWCAGTSLFLLLLYFCVAVGAASPLVCVRAIREGCRHDGPLSPYVHAVEPCVPLLFASPSSICVLVCVCCRGLECVCLLPWIGVCVLRGVQRTVHAWLPPSPHVWCALCVCVCLPHLSSPLLLSMSLTVQISATPLNDHTHDGEELTSAVRPVGACPVLLPVPMR